ncbi:MULTISPECIES: helix-turn-helix transcriptional regulator [Clostridium]|uniref:Helix-turn-helix transcriptional regulator n=1 Tax=Clostridium cibarium TaxID=2762247 RepID=A0ABR8PV30_9CLOT|nr:MULTISPECIES: helix-turn-helix transcriptional regulator [Clostridium]MBD7912021.1 helix-turn-helix transcriptional regulator [Clostridium cibarium]
MLKKLRLRNGYTIAEIAKLLGYKSKSGYWALENGKVELTMSKIKKLSKIYGVEMKIFFE